MQSSLGAGRHLLPLIVSCNQVQAPCAVHEREVLKLDNLVVRQVNRVKLVLTTILVKVDRPAHA